MVPAAQAQQVISGTVTDGAAGGALAGANVFVPNTTVGTTTDAEGRYRLRVPADADTLAFSFVGYETRRVAIAGRERIDIQLQPAALAAEEVVVTALGIAREQRTIGYSVQEVEAAEVSETAGINALNSLQGKLAGVRIQQSGTGQGGSSRIVIRGNRNLGSSNQPLFVVDGIPIQGSGQARTGEFGGLDLGGGISDINPNSIESITVLRGANAAALYGQEGASGAIIIETKKGTEEPQVTFSSRTTIEQPLVLPDLQNTYGRGSNGTVCGNADCPTGDSGAPAVFSGDLSWGPRMEGQPVEIWTGAVVPFSPQPDNVDRFFDTAYGTTNSLAFSTGSESVTARASISNLQSESLLPGGTYDRTNLSLVSSADVADPLTVDGRVSYVTQSAFNRPQVARSPDNVIYNMYYFPRNLRLQDLRDFRDEDGQPRVWTQANFSQRNNPYWSVNLNTNEDSRDRLLGYLRVQYDFAPWLRGFVRGGTDYTQQRREVRVATNTSYKPNGEGEYEVAQSVSQQTTYDFLLDAERDLTDQLHGQLYLGGSWRFERAETSGTTGRGLSIPNFFTPSNLETQTPIYGLDRRQIRSLYALTELRYSSYLFLELTARNDWSSTLPSGNNSYFYPSATLGFIFTDLLESDPLTYGKLRASVAGVGSDAPPERTLLEFTVRGDGQSGLPFGSAPTVLPPVDLRPEITRSYEAGLDLGFFDDRIELSGTYYRTDTRNQIIDLELPPSSGFREGTINAGSVRNQGVELLMQGAVVDAGRFRWNVTANWARNWSEIIDLTETVRTFTHSNQLGVVVQSRAGGPFGEIVGSSYARTEDGRRIIGEDGLPVAGPDTVLGEVQPNWTGGLTNTFRLGNFSLRTLIDVRQGGSVYSRSNAIAARQGTAAFTLEGREDWYNDSGGYVAEGVVNTGTAENPNYEPNTQAVNPQAYWSSVSGVAEEFVYDASFVKLREVTLSYRVPAALLGATPLQEASVSLTGRNLAFLYKNTPGFDPESAIGSGFGVQGREIFAFPQTRSFGINLNLTF
jgi:TonB-linked SusC/RagA family outer membrane protein